jgi:hypothetical protein
MSNEYRDPETLSDSDEEIHKNIDTKSYRKFIKEKRAQRFEELKSKNTLSQEETKELQELEYKLLPVDKDVSENSFRTSKEDEGVDYSDDLIMIFHNNTVKYFVEYMDRKRINLEAFEDLIYLNLSEAIKNGNDDLGFEFCKMGLMARWTREYGRGFICKFMNSEEKMNEMTQEHYEESKKALLSMKM